MGCRRRHSACACHRSARKLCEADIRTLLPVGRKLSAARPETNTVGHFAEMVRIASKSMSYPRECKIIRWSTHKRFRGRGGQGRSLICCNFLQPIVSLTPSRIQRRTIPHGPVARDKIAYVLFVPARCIGPRRKSHYVKHFRVVN
jgi:hypothetical protein